MDTTTLDSNTITLMVTIAGSWLTLVGLIFYQSNRLDNKIDALDSKIGTKIDALDTKFDTKIDTKIDAPRHQVRQEVRRVGQGCHRRSREAGEGGGSPDGAGELRWSSVHPARRGRRRSSPGRLKPAPSNGHGRVRASRYDCRRSLWRRGNTRSRLGPWAGQ